MILNLRLIPIRGRRDVVRRLDSLTRSIIRMEELIQFRDVYVEEGSSYAKGWKFYYNDFSQEVVVFFGIIIESKSRAGLAMLK